MRIFAEISSFDFFDTLKNQIRSDIHSKSKKELLGVDENEYIAYLVDKYSLEEVTIDFNSESFNEPVKKNERRRDQWSDEEYMQEVYMFTIKYKFSGSPEVFSIKPSRFQMTSTEVNVENHTSQVAVTIKTNGPDANEFRRLKDGVRSRTFVNLSNANADVAVWNSNLEKEIRKVLQSRKAVFLKENDFFEAIQLKVNEDTSSIFSVPAVKKKVVPQPIVSKNKEFASQPSLAITIYNDILDSIYNIGKGIEKKPSMYIGKDEEALRDVFQLLLEGRYEGATATSETFNKSGKTDIMVKYSKDGTNLFVAECKFWNGASEFKKAISQLFDRYLTWRDSKSALIIFVKNSDFTNVINTIKEEAPKHAYYKKNNGSRGESSWSYIFQLPGDPNKDVYLEIIAFHFDK